MTMVPDAEKAYTDCTSGTKELRDLPTCITDIEGLIPEVEAVIADFKAGNEAQALADLAKMVPDAEKAYSDCTSGKKMVSS